MAPDSRREVLDSWPQRPPSLSAPASLSLSHAGINTFSLSLSLSHPRGVEPGLRWRKRADRVLGVRVQPRICRWLDTSRRMVGGPAVHFAAVKPVVHSFAPPCSPSPALSLLPISVSLALIRSIYLVLRTGRTWVAIGSVSVLLFRPSRGRKPRSLMMSADVGGVQCRCWCWSDITKYRNKMGII